MSTPARQTYLGLAAPEPVGAPVRDEDDFRRLYDEAFTPLLRYALRRVDDPADAADVVADTFLVAWRRYADIPDGADAIPWLYGIARGVVANHHRAGARRSRLAERLRAELAMRARPSSLPAADRVRAALDRLDEEDRELLRLANWEGLSPAQIAVSVGASAGAIRTRLSRARKRLKKHLQPHPDAMRGEHDA